MRNITRKFFIPLYLILFVIPLYAQKDVKLTYTKPAAVWTEALPVGNGRLGAMVFGGVNDELIQLNEATLWSGGPVKKNINPDAYQNLEIVRNALREEDFAKAYESTKKMQGLYSESYLPLGDLNINQDFKNAVPTSYSRELNLEDAITTTTFTINGVTYKREVFASAPGQCIIIRLTASQNKKLSVSINASSQLKFEKSFNSNSLYIKGRAPAHADPSYINYNKEPIVYNDATGCNGMRFEIIMKPVVKHGNITIDNDTLKIENATEIVLFVSAATSFNGYDKCPDSDGKDEHLLATGYLKNAVNKNYNQLLKEHFDDFHNYFNRVSLNINESKMDLSAVPTDKRLMDYATGKKDNGLEALYFQYGRYLLISSSRTKDAPANLQGIWNKELRAPWSSNYTTNINVQMNYWPVESANLTELFSPLNDLIKNVSITGAETAKSFYHANGWVLHHNSDIWATTNPVGDLGKGDPKWANWYMGANWISRHLWEHYQYTGNKEYLKEIYPIMKGAALFSLDWLQTDKEGYLVTMPSTSPENDFYYGDKKKGIVTVASTMDMAIIKDLFKNVMQAATVLNTDKDFVKELETANGKLYPFKIGSKGQLQEWYKDFEDVDPHHRHTSHLYALHPAELISPIKTPELAEAARRTLDLRGDDGTGWSLAWKVNMWARLLDGNHAYTLFKNLLRLTKENDTSYNKGGGAYPNLFDAHPPFQIDGNFAGTAGVIEMLMQSQNDEIFLLPALPDEWQDGNIKGIVAKGNFVTAINWKSNKLATATLLSRNGGKCTVRSKTPFMIAGLKIKSQKSEIGYTLTFDSKKGKSYDITATN
ncbi:alpha-L-fucosidase [Flavobacterium rivuli WB 3.3-2 = DSM 21788]|uniref:Alpha-L-fucosidase n=1 Tax=Flavobacterium rivuli WB 3.3-2 = DSM 21788 TaxID=1121895 RepID=A0A0A2M5E4_9FLAO|nr:glycoside hydrolase family 95 protein [Flavobacterium rivuli]KGO86831.1 alpha-L-fucosidase [Flavobacterium rivuli WB 3.3-2 = DSM 21788]